MLGPCHYHSCCAGYCHDYDYGLHNYDLFSEALRLLNLNSCLQLWLSPILAAISMVAIELANSGTTAVAAVKEILGSEETWL